MALNRSKSAFIVGLFTVGVMVWLSGWPAKYLNWSSLTADEVVQDAARYAEEKFGGGSACIYEVRCKTGRAQLYVVEDIDTWDIEATKDIAWKRRFSDQCPGRTANIGLHVLPSSDGPWTDSTMLAFWLFETDRFIPTMSRFYGGAFSEGNWQRCSPEHSIDLFELAD